MLLESGWAFFAKFKIFYFRNFLRRRQKLNSKKFSNYRAEKPSIVDGSYYKSFVSHASIYHLLLKKSSTPLKSAISASKKRVKEECIRKNKKRGRKYNFF